MPFRESKEKYQIILHGTILQCSNIPFLSPALTLRALVLNESSRSCGAAFRHPGMMDDASNFRLQSIFQALMPLSHHPCSTGKGGTRN